MSDLRDDLITEKFRREVMAAVESGEVTQEEVADAKIIDSSVCCNQPLTKDIRCSSCQGAHKARGAEYVIDQENRIHFIVER
jgi:hypothetical protein